MIKNEKQLKVANNKLQSLMETQRSIESSDKAAWHAYQDVVDELSAEISEYEDVKHHRVVSFRVNSVDDLGDALIKGRIANGWTHAVFAERAGVSEQLIQRDEARDFENAGLARIAELFDVLGYELVGEVRPRGMASPALDGYSLSGTRLLEWATRAWTSSSSSVSDKDDAVRHIFDGGAVREHNQTRMLQRVREHMGEVSGHED